MRPQDEHVQCAMENGHALRSLFPLVANRPSIANDGSHSTIVMSSEDGKLRSRVMISAKLRFQHWVVSQRAIMRSLSKQIVLIRLRHSG